ncbi:MAG TPA: glutamyl-tRNA reductase [Mycetocola sp.]|jgi:glutamyl-tRNA reductase|uniref:glutamyl-tRNA reductase n=1 Tax=Mycetocola sp. TaxID=1871042 RepID=UPI0026323AF7|nr:glutamyl-tRNA reductase [Mycetocola sp.]MCU1560249.1 glutamyl-tRNA reductase [Mycetocola sp.]HEV7849032.1 glutamyl-tRNA reductase [Mycetocola sp.]
MCLTASHKNASFDLLERLSGGAESVAERITEHAECVAGAVVISTCNRFEAYIDLDEPITAGQQVGVEAATAAISAASGIPADQLHSTWSVHTDEAAARHLFAVSAGLESVIVGEGEIAGQVRRSLETARKAGTTTSDLERLFQRASQTSRGVKNNTPLGRAGRSIVRLALDLAESRIIDWSAVRVLLIGTGAYAGASLAALRDRGVTDVAVYSPSGRAAGFAASHAIRAIEADAFAREAAEATIVVTCTTASGFVLDAALLNAGRRESHESLPPFEHDGTPGCPVHTDAGQLVIDLGLPRNVDPDVAGVHGVDLLDLETIRIHAPLEELQATDHAHEIVDRAARKFAAVTDEQSLAPAVVALRRHAQELLESEIARVAPRDPDGVAEQALRHMMGRLLHAPTVRARDLARAGDAQRYIDALDALFGLAVQSESVVDLEADEAAS